MSDQLAITLANLKTVDSSIVHSLAVAADTAETLSRLSSDPEALTSQMQEFAQCTQMIGTLLHDEIDKLGGPIALSIAKVAYALPIDVPEQTASSAAAAADTQAEAAPGPPQGAPMADEAQAALAPAGPTTANPTEGVSGGGGDEDGDVKLDA